MDAAEQSGVLKFFNQEYQRRRQAAVAAGKNIAPYAAVRARLRRALAKRAAINPAERLAMPTSLIPEVFGAAEQV